MIPLSQNRRFPKRLNLSVDNGAVPRNVSLKVLVSSRASKSALRRRRWAMPYGSHNYIMTLYKDTIFGKKVTLCKKNILSGKDLQLECRGSIGCVIILSKVVDVTPTGFCNMGSSPSTEIPPLRG